MRAAVYARVSTEDQEREGTSLESQTEACLKLAAEQGYDVPADCVFREAKTGATLERPELDNLRGLIKNKQVDAAICYATDRLARNPIHIAIIAEECDKRKVALIFVTEPMDSSPEGMLIMYVKGYAAQIEREKIKERTMRGKRERAKAGRLPSGSHANLYGYTYIKGEGVRQINELEAMWVRDIFNWYVVEGLTMADITYRLRELKVPTAKGKGFWHRAVVGGILKNPAYCGRTYAFMYSGHRLKPEDEWLPIHGATPPIISEELYEAAQRRLRRNKELSRRNTKQKYLLQGFVFCKRCGRRYSAGDKHYRCTRDKKLFAPIRCDNKPVRVDALEGMVWQQIEKLLANPDMVSAEIRRRKQEAKASPLGRELERVEIQLKNRQKQKDHIWRGLGITGDEGQFKKDITRLSEEVKTLELERLQLQRKIGEEARFIASAGDVKKACKLIVDGFKTLTHEDKRFILDRLQVKVWVNMYRVEIEGAIPIPKGGLGSDNLDCHYSKQGFDTVPFVTTSRLRNNLVEKVRKP